MNDKNNATDKEVNQQYTENYLKRLEKKVDLIYDANVYNSEACELWERVKNETWIKPEIREKWEKELKVKKNN